MTKTIGPRDARASLTTATALLVMLAMTAALVAGCGQGTGGGGSPPSNDRGGEVATPADVEGTWVGSVKAAEPDDEPRLMLSLEQDGAALSGAANVANPDKSVHWLPALEGEARASREVSLSYVVQDDDGKEVRWTFEGDARGADTISGEAGVVWGNGEEDKGPFEARRLDLTDAADMSLATVQALYDRNGLWLAEHGQYEWEQDLREQYGTSEEGDDAGTNPDADFAANIYEQFSDEGGDALPSGVGIEVDKESFVVTENPPLIAAGFEYTRSDGEAGTALVTMVESGADSESAGYQITEIELNYPTDGGSETLFLGV